MSIEMETQDAIAELRLEFVHKSLDMEDVDPDPLVQFGLWFEQARKANILEANAMTLATVNEDGRPSARTVLLKGFDDRGFWFYTNYGSRKARELQANDRAALVFFWKELERQVIITGTATTLDAAESDVYFRQRPRGSQLGAWASPQSERIESRSVLEARLEEVTQQFEGAEVPRPPHWGGFIVSPDRVEFWQGRPNRLHDRLLYAHTSKGWSIQRLAP
jgi:pyridoxamine 5'-phosphate oxidase